MVDLEDVADLVARRMEGERVTVFLPEDGEVYAATGSALSYRDKADLERWVIVPMVELLKARVAGQGKPVDGVWRIRWAGLPGDLQLELAA